jgi:hypothetical protein
MDLGDFPNPDITTGQRKLSSERFDKATTVRKLNVENSLEDTLLPMDGILLTMDMLGVTTLPQLTDLFNITNVLENVISPLPATGRRLAPEPIRPGNDFVDEINDFLNDFLNANTEQAFEASLFMFKCNTVFQLQFPLCIALFSLFKTTDASLCYYQDELGCTIDESCTKDLAFTTEYNKRQASLYLPSFSPEDPTNFILGEILAPCSTCASEKNKCAPYWSVDCAHICVGTLDCICSPLFFVCVTVETSFCHNFIPNQYFLVVNVSYCAIPCFLHPQQQLRRYVLWVQFAFDTPATQGSEVGATCLVCLKVRIPHWIVWFQFCFVCFFVSILWLSSRIYILSCWVSSAFVESVVTHINSNTLSRFHPLC